MEWTSDLAPASRARSLVLHYLGFVVVGAAVLAPVTVLLRLGFEPAVDAGPVVFTPLATLVLAPLVEEFVFRYGIRQLTDRHWMWIGALLFGIAEALLSGLATKLFTHTLLGFAFAYVYQRSGSIWSAVAAHSGINSGLLAVAWLAMQL